MCLWLKFGYILFPPFGRPNISQLQILGTQFLNPGSDPDLEDWNQY